MSHNDGHKSSRMSGAPLAAFVVAAYLIPFLVVLIDEGVFRTFFFNKHFGDWGKETFRMVYFPFFKLFGP